jgi:hypothetical protein
VIGDVDALPNAADNVLIVKNPRKRDGKDLPYLDNSVMWWFGRFGGSIY